jgi:Transposase IS4
MKTQPVDKTKIRLTLNLNAVPLYFDRLLMSLSWCMVSNGIGNLFWSILEVRFARKRSSVRSVTGDLVFEGRDAIGGDNRRTPYDHFMAMFPPDALMPIATMTSEKLREKGKQATMGADILKFFGILILGTRCCVFQIPKE